MDSIRSRFVRVLLGGRTVNYYEHHLGDYMRDTAHLSMLEDAAYRRLLDAYYVREKPLPADLRECYKLARASSKQEREVVAYVLREFFTLGDDGHHQARADEEIAKFRPSRRRPAPASMLDGSVHEPNSNRITNVIRTYRQQDTNVIRTIYTARPSPVPSHQTPILPYPLTGKVHEFPPGSIGCGRCTRGRSGRTQQPRRLPSANPIPPLVETMVKAVEAQRTSRDWTKDGGQFIPHLSTWLNEGRWMDEIGSFSQANDIFAGAR